MTPQQWELMNAAADFLVKLDHVIPATTVHYAVEDVRRAVETLLTQANAGQVKTYDVPCRDAYCAKCRIGCDYYDMCNCH